MVSFNEILLCKIRMHMHWSNNEQNDKYGCVSLVSCPAVYINILHHWLCILEEDVVNSNVKWNFLSTFDPVSSEEQGTRSKSSSVHLVRGKRINGLFVYFFALSNKCGLSLPTRAIMVFWAPVFHALVRKNSLNAAHFKVCWHSSREKHTLASWASAWVLFIYSNANTKGSKLRGRGDFIDITWQLMLC